MTIQKITPFLWFDNQAEEAVRFYTSVFRNSKIGKVARYNSEGAEVSGRPKNSVMTVDFQIEGQEFTALNGGPAFKFSQAISFVVSCETQDEVDHYWNKLSAGGQVQQCGWLIDKYGVTWQIVPRILAALMDESDPEKANRVMKSVLTMIKIEIPALQRAAEGK